MDKVLLFRTSVYITQNNELDIEHEYINPTDITKALPKEPLTANTLAAVIRCALANKLDDEFAALLRVL